MFVSLPTCISSASSPKNSRSLAAAARPWPHYLPLPPPSARRCEAEAELHAFSRFQPGPAAPGLRVPEDRPSARM